MTVRTPRSMAHAVLTAAILIPLLTLNPTPARADFPDPELHRPQPWEVEEALAVLRRHLEASDAPTASTTGSQPISGDAAPTLGDAALSLSGQLHLAAESAVFTGGELFLWDDASNLGLGRSALAAVTTGSKHTTIGQGALASETDGILNTAVGFAALENAYSFSGNAAAGSRALLTNIVFGNTAVGSAALVLNHSGLSNTAVGYAALSTTTSGDNNTAVGARALYSGDSGSFNDNTALGAGALFSNLSGSNAAAGFNALFANTTGSGLVALGASALDANDDDVNNTAIGSSALGALSNGSRNTALGEDAGDTLINGSDNIFIGHDASGLTTESHTIRIGTTGTFSQDRAFIAGIRGTTTTNADAVPVLIDSAGQLGTASSSREVKQDIRPIGDLSERLFALRPVAFRYRHHLNRDPEAALQFGLIAEEVAEVFPELVIYDEHGRPETVKYHLLAPLLLHEINNAERRLAGRRVKLEQSRAELEAVQRRLSAIEARSRPSGSDAG